MKFLLDEFNRLKNEMQANISSTINLKIQCFLVTLGYGKYSLNRYNSNFIYVKYSKL